MSISYPLRTARFCSAIFMASRSVILRLTILMASFWLMPRMCMVTRILPSVSINSAKMRSWISGAVICKKLTAPYISPQPVPIESELPALRTAAVCRVEDAVKQLQPLLPVQHMGGGPHDLEAVEGVGLDAGEARPRRRQVFRLDGQGIPAASSRMGSRSSPWEWIPNRSSSGPCSTYRLLSDTCTPMVGS